mmetsp:Transcript_33220/g.51697  ORF Transcript_33220/g.51697 Transcript_33220/m.51697 type:complete len:189 (+) Transcript_33220:54-620(+)
MIRGAQIGNTTNSPSGSVANVQITFECNICLEQASEPVVTRCGHLFCWACLHQWLNTPRRSQVHGGLQPGNGTSLCPVCKSAVSEQTVIPIYARGGGSDPRTLQPTLPSRPPGERIEPVSPPPELAESFTYGGTARNYTFSAGYGQFPVICSLVFRGSSLLDVPMASRKAKLVVSVLAGVAVFAMTMM